MDAAAAATAAAAAGTRHSGRERKASKATAVVDAETRRNATAARLDALELDNAVEEAGNDSDEYIAEEEEGGGAGPRVRKVKGAAKRATRGAAAERRGPKAVSQLLEEAGLPDWPSYLSAEQGPPRFEAPRKYCSVCGFKGGYTCPRCGMRYCGRRCLATHADTRCLRFTV